ncbi:bifunctional methylenetetrahydrofolate dehydrogenase/cyclohydrolase, mitochondrial isoform X1 [Anopheles stephensi]|nr:bifunctional methylenetetrahydrofolate dehydrogenase/cyclohydrolase, mitochondrial isoform X1 [Anopheles stephensi]XP_035909219.1 bifunctional methylenetetrahydrofolate dehydrogenase/cyclohydrolase, mitochondrial isoform X1 [Anopheles stephensi]
MQKLFTNLAEVNNMYVIALISSMGGRNMFTSTKRCLVCCKEIKIQQTVADLVSKRLARALGKSVRPIEVSILANGTAAVDLDVRLSNPVIKSTIMNSNSVDRCERLKHGIASSNTTTNRLYHSATKPINSASRMAQLIDGKQIASEIREELRNKIEAWKVQGNRAPQLTAILIGEDAASATYVSNKMKAAADVGIDSKTERYDTDITEQQLLDRIDQLNNDDAVDGILIQLPIPRHIDERKICNSVSCDKDVDGFNERNIGRLCLDMNTLIPCTPLGVQELIKRAGVETFGKNAVVVGRSKNVGMPIAMLLHADGRNDTCAMDATVTICHRFTPPEELKRFCRSADIIVTATGVPGLITADMVKEGATVIDVGITRVADPATGKTKLVGDVDFDEVRKVAGHITPVPGGVGPMTVAMLMKNTWIAAKNLAKKRNTH